MGRGASAWGGLADVGGSGRCGARWPGDVARRSRHRLCAAPVDQPADRAALAHGAARQGRSVRAQPCWCRCCGDGTTVVGRVIARHRMPGFAQVRRQGQVHGPCSRGARACKAAAGRAVRGVAAEFSGARGTGVPSGTNTGRRGFRVSRLNMRQSSAGITAAVGARQAQWTPRGGVRSDGFWRFAGSGRADKRSASASEGEGRIARSESKAWGRMLGQGRGAQGRGEVLGNPTRTAVCGADGCKASLES